MSKSVHVFTENELPCSHRPWGLTWIKDRLLFAGRTNPMAWFTEGRSDPSKRYELLGPTRTITVSIDEANVSKNQMAFELQSVGSLATNQPNINVPPMSTLAVTITGPVGKVVKVRFDGVGFVSETQFTIPANGNYDFMFGPCPASQRVVMPQMYDFYVEDGSCSPVAVMATFR